MFTKHYVAGSFSLTMPMGVDYVVSESESELFTGDTSKDNHSPGPTCLRKLVPSPHN